ncbi:MAG: hypothetical protein IJE59_05420 [Clostridia bacterium]|nr:hypothetical protein [Clostridia bacterium]
MLLKVICFFAAAIFLISASIAIIFTIKLKGDYYKKRYLYMMIAMIIVYVVIGSLLIAAAANINI